MSKTLACAFAMVGFAAAANAADWEAGSPKDPIPDDLTWHGVTLYGTIDAGYVYQTHGAPFNSLAVSGFKYIASSTKNLRGPISAIAPNGLEQSAIGVKAEEQLGYGFASIFKANTGFDPLSGNLANGPGSIAQNNGLSQLQQTSFGDSSRAGQAFNGELYGGVTNPAYGTLTLGRQQSLLLDAVGTYDPQHGSYAFSIHSGKDGGGGDTEDSRWDNSVKYIYQYGPVHAAAMYSDGGAETGFFGGGHSFEVGGSYRGLSVDAIYEKTKGAVSAAPLSTSFCSAPSCPANSVAGTIADDAAWSVQGKYSFDLGGEGSKDVNSAAKVTLYAGYERIIFANPQNPVAAGSITEGGFALATVNNTNYFTDEIFQVAWVGAQYELPSGWNFTGAYYRYIQSSFLTGTNGTTCAAATSANKSNANFIGNPIGSNCAGTVDVASFVADYQFTKHFDIYAGVSYSVAVGGLASGYLNNNTLTPMLGGRLKF